MRPALGGALEGAFAAASQRPRVADARDREPARGRLTLALWTIAAAGALTACAPQSVRVDEVRDAEAAARDAIRLEPGPPPVIENRLLFPLRSATRGDAGRDDAGRARAAAAPELRIATRVDAHPDVWARIRDGLALDREVDRPRVQRELDWYRRHQDYLDRTADRARLYLPWIVREVERRGVPADLALLPVVESAFQPFAYSPMAASGLWQFIPATGRRYGLKQNWWYDGRRDVVESTRAALDYLQKLHAEFDGDWLLAIAAYNSGEGNVHKAIARNRRAGEPTDFWSLRLPRETRAYVPRLLAIAEVVAAPARHDLALEPIPDRPYFREVSVDAQIDLALAADLAEISLDEIYLLNPGFNRWATDPEGPHRLVIPVDAVDGFVERLAAVPPDERVRWTRHVIETGETLGGIAERYRTSAAALRDANSLDGNRIRAGGSLMVPDTLRASSEYELSSHIRQALRRVAPTSGQKQVHRVRSGENLWLIARRYAVPVRKLAAWNGIPAKGIIRPGQRLAVWTGRGADPGPPARAGGNAVHVVRRGDTLSGIALRNGTSVAAITALNGMTRDAVLRPGQKLRVARAGDGGDDGAPAAPAATVTARYTVRRGDTLSGIALRNGTSVAAIAARNGISRDTVLRPGQELRVARTRDADRHGDDGAAGAARDGQSPASTPAPLARYTVRRGDTLSGIALRVGTTVTSITSLNGLSRDAVLRPGQELRVRGDRVEMAAADPGDGRRRIRYTVRRGDSLWHISRRFNVTVASLREWNELADGRLLHPGQEIDVYVPEATKI